MRSKIKWWNSRERGWRGDDLRKEGGRHYRNSPPPEEIVGFRGRGRRRKRRKEGGARVRRRNKAKEGWGSAITTSAATVSVAGVAGVAEVRFERMGVEGGREIA